MATTIQHRIQVMAGVFASRPAMHRLAVDEIEQEIGSEVDSRIKMLWDADVSIEGVQVSVNDWLAATYGMAPDGATQRVTVHSLRYVEESNTLAFRLSLAVGNTIAWSQ